VVCRAGESGEILPLSADGDEEQVERSRIARGYVPQRGASPLTVEKRCNTALGSISRCEVSVGLVATWADSDD